MTYSFIYPKIWNDVKFQLESKETLVYKDSVPDYVKTFCEKFEIELIEFSNFDVQLHLDNLLQSSVIYKETGEWITDEYGAEVPVTEVDWDAMWTSWDEIEDYKTLYIEANPMNLCTTINMFKKFIRKEKSEKWKELGYDIRLLIWDADIAYLREEQVSLIEKDKEFEADVIPFTEDFPYPRISIAQGAIDVISNAKICHIVSNGTEVMPIYRRMHLNKALIEKYGDDVVTNAFLGSFEYCIISHPALILPTAEHYIYERTDNWSAMDGLQETDELALSKAEIITCSSKWLYEDTLRWLSENRKDDEVKVYYIPNGNKLYDYPSNVEKFEKKSAIYVGNHLNKIDMTILTLLCDMNSDWDFYLYADKATELMSIPDNLIVHEMVDLDDLFPVICKCHVGLIPLVTSSWTQGMLSNKLFNYINARIPTVYIGGSTRNYEDYEGKVAFNLSNIESLDAVAEKDVPEEIYKSFERSWDDVTKEVLDAIQL